MRKSILLSQYSQNSQFSHDNRHVIPPMVGNNKGAQIHVRLCLEIPNLLFESLLDSDGNGYRCADRSERQRQKSPAQAGDLGGG